VEGGGETESEGDGGETEGAHTVLDDEVGGESEKNVSWAERPRRNVVRRLDVQGAGLRG
jgi:hypothetical protein